MERECIYCGKPLQEDAVYCSQCGKRVREDQLDGAPRRRRRRRLLIRRILFAALGGGLLAVLILLPLLQRPAARKPLPLQSPCAPESTLPAYYTVSPTAQTGRPEIVHASGQDPFSGFAGGRGSAEDPYLVATPEQLDRVREDLSAHYKQIAPLDMSGYTAFAPIGEVSFDVEVEEEWSTRLGLQGSYDGSHFPIRNLTIAGVDNGGLFACIDTQGAVINVTLEGCTVIGGGDNKNQTMGCLAGANGGLVSGCISDGSVSGQGMYSTCGGLVGTNIGRISDCRFQGSAAGAGEFAKVGGIAGIVLPGGLVEGCVNSGKVSGGYGAGGIVGWNRGEVRSCIQSGVLLGEAPAMGPIYGRNKGTVTDCTEAVPMEGN